MSNTTEVDLNEGVQIILARMKTNPEEFFDEGGRCRWIFKETLREVLTEIEKAALFEGLKHVRRMEITAKAAATVLRDEEQEKQEEAQGIPPQLLPASQEDVVIVNIPDKIHDPEYAGKKEHGQSQGHIMPVQYGLEPVCSGLPPGLVQVVD